MKKLLYLALTLLLAATLCACGGDETTGNTTTKKPNGTTTGSTADTTQPTTGTAEHTHDYKETVVTAATCTEKGMMFLKCNTCGDSDYKEIPATGHTEVIDAAVVPTCTVYGLTEGKHCSACNKILVAQYSVNIIDHDYEQQICKACSEHEFLRFGLNEDGNSYYVYYIASKNFAGEIIIPEKYKGLPVTSIGEFAFCRKNLTSIVIPDSVTSIGECAFELCINLTSITIPNSVTSIGNDTFRSCSSLASITIPDSVTSIGGCAFYGCSSLTSIVIPDSATSIGGYAFYDCSSLTDFYYDGTYEQWNAIKKYDNWISSSINYTVHCTNGNYSRYE